MQEDVKVDNAFFRSCKALLKQHNCLEEPSDGTHVAISMSHSLTCLMDAEAESEKERKIYNVHCVYT